MKVGRLSRAWCTKVSCSAWSRVFEELEDRSSASCTTYAGHCLSNILRAEDRLEKAGVAQDDRLFLTCVSCELNCQAQAMVNTLSQEAAVSYLVDDVPDAANMIQIFDDFACHSTTPNTFCFGLGSTFWWCFSGCLSYIYIWQHHGSIA